MFTSDTFESRIFVVRIESCDTVDEARAVAVAVGSAIKVAGGPVVATADMRRARLFTPEVADVFIALLRADNPHIERSAHLLGAGAAFTLQLERIVREAASPARRTFRESREALTWLSEILTPRQQVWLRSWYDAP
jgi:hypothetical protein